MTFLKKHKILSSIILILCVWIGYSVLKPTEVTLPEFITTEKSNLIQEVNATGRVKPVEDIKLGFEASGRVKSILTEVGKNIGQGEVLVQLENNELLSQLYEAEASLDAQKAKLAELKTGTRPENIDVKRSELQKGEQDLANIYLDVPDTLNDAFLKADDAIHVKTSDIFTGSSVNAYQLTYNPCDSILELETEDKREEVEDTLTKWGSEQKGLGVDQVALENALSNALAYTKEIRAFLELVNQTLTTTCTLANSNLDTYRTNINTARTNINTAISNINTEQQTLSGQKITVEKINNELNLLLAGSTPESIQAQEAIVKQYEAQIATINTKIAKTTLRSPINGTVTKIDISKGEIVSAQSPVIYIISGGLFEIETNVPEVDIAEIKVGDTASVTLDAYRDEVIFEAIVSAIDPAEIIIEGVPTYKVTLQFKSPDIRIKSGMTANIDIQTDKRDNVIAIPTRAIETIDGVKKVKILNDDNTISEVTVETGLRGSDGRTEILSGLTNGQRVVTFIKE